MHWWFIVLKNSLWLVAMLVFVSMQATQMRPTSTVSTCRSVSDSFWIEVETWTVAMLREWLRSTGPSSSPVSPPHCHIQTPGWLGNLYKVRRMSLMNPRRNEFAHDTSSCSTVSHTPCSNTQTYHNPTVCLLFLLPLPLILQDNLSACSILLSSGADPKAKDNDGLTGSRHTDYTNGELHVGLVCLQDCMWLLRVDWLTTVATSLSTLVDPSPRNWTVRSVGSYNT